jgi:hypothetical protein
VIPSGLGPSVDGRWLMSGRLLRRKVKKTKFLGLTVDGRVRMLRSLARRREKIHGVWKFNTITPYHPSHAVNDLCALPFMAVDCCLHRRLRRKLLGLAVDGRVRMLRSLARRRQKMHGVWKFNNIIPSHPSHAVDTFCARPSMAVGWCLHRRRRRK